MTVVFLRNTGEGIGSRVETERETMDRLEFATFLRIRREALQPEDVALCGVP